MPLNLNWLSWCGGCESYDHPRHTCRIGPRKFQPPATLITYCSKNCLPASSRPCHSKSLWEVDAYGWVAISTGFPSRLEPVATLWLVGITAVLNWCSRQEFQFKVGTTHEISQWQSSSFLVPAFSSNLFPATWVTMPARFDLALIQTSMRSDIILSGNANFWYWLLFEKVQTDEKSFLLGIILESYEEPGWIEEADGCKLVEFSS